jgi:insulysin
VKTLCNILSVNHHRYDTKYVLCGEFVIRDIFETSDYIELYKKYIGNNFIRIINTKEYCISSKKNRISSKNNKYLIAPNYKTEYIELNMKQPKLKKLYYMKELINLYIDIKPNIIGRLDKYETPKLIGTKQWYGGCSKFDEPFVYIWLQLNNKKYFDSEKNYNLTKLSCNILNFLIEIIMYKPLEVCSNINFTPSSSTSSIVVNINTLNDIKKLKLLIKEFVDFMKNIRKHSDKLSNNYIDNLIVSCNENYKNVNFMNGWDYSSYYVMAKLLETEFLVEDLIKSIKNINRNDIIQYLETLLVDTTLTTMIYGNITKSNANDIFDNFKLHTTNLFENAYHKLPNIIPIQSEEFQHKNNKETDNCITHYYPIGKFNSKEYILLNLFINIMSQPFFDKIRTKYQLGYLVRMIEFSVRDYFYVMQKIQSGNSIDEVEKRIEEFNKDFIDIIKKIDFKTFTKTLRNEINQKDNSISDLYSRHLSEISSREFLFNRKDLLLKTLDKIKLQDLIDFVNEKITSKSKVNLIISGH